jgi:hypothetical protein
MHHPIWVMLYDMSNPMKKRKPLSNNVLRRWGKSFPVENRHFSCMRKLPGGLHIDRSRKAGRKGTSSMSARHALAAVVIIGLAAPASATVLSASNQVVGTKSSKADYLRVTQVQAELDATMKDVNDAAVANGALSSAAPSTEGPGYILQKEGEGGRHREDGDEWSVVNPGDAHDTGRLSLPVSSRGQMPGTADRHRGNGGNRRGGGGRHGGGAHAAPEPSTWLLLGVGLALIGGYALLRRREALAR